jgi:HAMP domain-containing protein/signal transduction histidine kinase/CheY-like chemotaxis protein
MRTPKATSAATTTSRRRATPRAVVFDPNQTYTAEQLRPLLEALQAAKEGDFTVRLPVERNGILHEISRAFNEVVGLNENMTQEVVRVGRLVGREGLMTERASIHGALGSWAIWMDSVNTLIEDLARPTTEVRRVITAVANGDLSQKMALEIQGTPVKGEFLSIGTTVNTMVDQLGSFSAEVTRVAREVGTEGKLGGQADVRGVSGTWKDLTDNVNGLASNLTNQVRNIALVTTAVANGDLSKKITVDAKGEILELKNTINTMVDQLNSFAAEVTRVAREVGTEGKLGGQARVQNVGGVWKDLTDNVNGLAGNLTNQVRNVAQVTTAVANGDLSKKITVDAKGEILELKNTINTMVDQLNSFAAEVTRVAREVGTEGKLGGQAVVKGVSGTWKDLTDNVNYMAGNLTDQVRNIAVVTTAVANGDLSQKITVDARGEILELKNTINTMVDQLNSFAAEVTRVAKEVGTEGILGGQAKVPNVAGTWKDLTENVNGLASNLTNQVRNIALVTTAVANGDLSKKITVDARGEILELKNTINTMVDQLNSFAAEVTRVAREVGTEGKLGGQADVRGVSGTWKDLTDNVNSMASNLTNQVRNIALVTTAVANGDLSQKITVDVKGEILELKNTINTMVDQLNSFAAEVTRVAREVGTEGKLGGQAVVKGVSGTWKDLTDNVNYMAGNLTDQVRNIALVTTAVANGDLSKKITVDVKGEILELKNTINTMVDQLRSFADEVTRVAREVGTEGKLGGQAKVPNVSGTWKDLTDNVNSMATNLTTQVRGIARVVTAVANGDLKQKLVLEAKGEVAALADTINSMTETLSIFADQVTTVAREVGTEGKLGGQAKVPNVSGTWKDLTDNVNYMANSLTVQVRAISEVATAVALGDLTRSITVEAQGEVSALKNNINQMITNLKDTTEKNNEQDWLKTNLARFSRLIQGQKTLDAVADLIMSELTPLVSAHTGVFFINDGDERGSSLKLMSSYAYQERKSLSNRFRMGEGLVGQCALERKRILLTNVPSDYIHISSGLGEAPPLNIVVLPVLFEGDIMAVIELASFQTFSQIHITFLEQLMESIGVVLNMIQASMTTETLLAKSESLNQQLQSQSQELQSQQEQLKQTNIELGLKAEELEDKAEQLAEQNQKVELKNREVELARMALEEKAEQLALSSRYKSEFLANMSHELRTPLNSMLILAKLLADNQEGNLSGKQVEFASTIHTSGGDLLDLINEILDLSKVEAGKMEVDVSEVPITDVTSYIDRSFRQMAINKNLDFRIFVDPSVPPAISTDNQRLNQILKNLLSNAFKFTERGSIDFVVSTAPGDVLPEVTMLRPNNRVLAFTVRDTGIGIPKNKQKLIFEAFQQADGTTSRKYGGTGLGLSISREITRLLGGRIEVQSEVGQGSSFTLYLPQQYMERHPTDALTDLTGNYDGNDLDGNGFDGSGFGSNGGSSTLSHSSAEVYGHRSITMPMPTLASAPTPVMNPVATAAAPESTLGALTTAPIARFQPHETAPLPTPPVMPALPVMPDGGSTAGQNLERVNATTTGQEGGQDVVSTSMDVIQDDRYDLEPGDSIVLIVEDDVHFANILLDLARQRGLKGLVALTGSDGLAMAREYKPSAITLDLQLPLLDGWTVLDHLKRDTTTRHIPVQVISVMDRRQGSVMGAISYLEKPVSKDALEGAFAHIKSFIDRGVRELLIVEDDEVQRNSIVELVGNQDVKTTAVGTGEAALEILKEKDFDCVVLDLGLPDMEGFELLKKIKRQAKYRELPVVIYTSKDLSKREETQLKKFAESIIVKNMKSPERLLDETALFLHRVVKNLPEAKRTIIEQGQRAQGLDNGDSTPVEPAVTVQASSSPKTPPAKQDPAVLRGHTVLIVDDDVRNVFALTSVLENYGLTVLAAENGQGALESLQQHPEITLVLMDVMMPGMDGYQTTTAIRQMEAFQDLPIIALTAKAMAGDREKCMAAGATDYITKPVDVDLLIQRLSLYVNAR